LPAQALPYWFRLREKKQAEGKNGFSYLPVILKMPQVCFIGEIEKHKGQYNRWASVMSFLAAHWLLLLK